MEGEDEDSEDERAFNNKPAWQRAICACGRGIHEPGHCGMLLLIIIACWSGQATTTIDQVHRWIQPGI